MPLEKGLKDLNVPKLAAGSVKYLTRQNPCVTCLLIPGASQRQASCCARQDKTLAHVHSDGSSVHCRTQCPNMLQPFCTYSDQYRGKNPGPSEQISSNCLQQCWFSSLSELHPKKLVPNPPLPVRQGKQDFSYNSPLSTLFSRSSRCKRCLTARRRVLTRLVLTWPVCLPQPRSQRSVEERSSQLQWGNPDKCLRVHRPNVHRLSPESN